MGCCKGSGTRGSKGSSGDLAWQSDFLAWEGKKKRHTHTKLKLKTKKIESKHTHTQKESQIYIHLTPGHVFSKIPLRQSYLSSDKKKGWLRSCHGPLSSMLTASRAAPQNHPDISFLSFLHRPSAGQLQATSTGMRSWRSRSSTTAKSSPIGENSSALSSHHPWACSWLSWIHVSVQFGDQSGRKMLAVSPGLGRRCIGQAC